MWFASMMDRIRVYFGLRLSHMVFAVSEQIMLQRKDINAQEATKAVHPAKNFFSHHRCI